MMDGHRRRRAAGYADHGEGSGHHAEVEDGVQKIMAPTPIAITAPNRLRDCAAMRTDQSTRKE